MEDRLKLPKTDYRVITLAMNAVAELEDGEYPFDTDAGEMIINKKTAETGTVRRNIYYKGSRIKIVDARKLLRETPPQEKSTCEDANEGASKSGRTLTGKQLEKKYKRKKILKVFPESGVLKKKKLAKAIAGFEKVAEKKMTGHEILEFLSTIKDNIKAEKLVALFDLL